MRWITLVFMLLMPCFSAVAQDVPYPTASIPLAREAVVGFDQAGRVLVVEPEGAVYLYDLLNTTPLLTTRYEGERLQAVVLQADQALLISYQSLALLDTQSGEIQEIFITPNQIIAADFLDGRIIARVANTIGGSSLEDLETFVWDAATLETVGHFPAGDDCLITSPADPVVEFMRHTPGFIWCFPHIEWHQTRYLRWNFWNNGDPRPVKVYEGEALLFELLHYREDGETLAPLESITWSPDGTKIMTLPQQGAIKLWDGQTGTLLYTLNAPVDTLVDSQWSADSTHLLTWGYTGDIFLWENGTLIHQWYHADNLVLGGGWLHDDQWIVTWGINTPWSAVVGEIWAVESGEKLALIVTPNGSAPKQVIEDHGLLVFHYDGQIDVYEIEYLAGRWEND